MTDKIPRISAHKLLKVLAKRGFKKVRQSGSHIILRNEDMKRVVVFYYSIKSLYSKILKIILDGAEISVEELKELL